MLKFEKSIYKEETFCRLCHNIIDGNFVVIGENIQQVLEVLLLKVNGTERDKSIMCHTCSTKLFAAFHFKATCMDTEDCIFPYIDSDMGAPVNLCDIYLKKRGKEHLKDILEDERICRLCMQVVTCAFTSIKEVNVDSLRIYIPEVNFNSVREPVICKVCLDSLDTHTRFLGNCLRVEEEFKNISCDKTIQSPFQIFTEEIELKLEDYNDFPSEDELVGHESEYQSENAGFTNNSMHNTKKESTRLDRKNFRLKNKDSSKGDPDYENNQERRLVLHKDIPEKDMLKCGSSDKGNFPKKQMLECDSCDFKTIYKSSLTQHQLKHRDILNGEMLKCYSCDYKTVHKQYLRRHQLTHKVSSKEQKYNCDICDYRTIYKSYLTQHQRRHKGEILKCDSCYFKTIYKKNLARHQLKHKDIPEEQMLKCDSCDYKTIHKRNLVNHQLLHKYVLEEHMLKCDACDYKTVHKQYLRRHQLTHKVFSKKQNYTCDSCDYIADCKNSLKKHELKHKSIPEEDMFKCDSCDFKTVYKSALVHHQLKHKGFSEEQMFRCHSCDYKTIQKGNLTQHLMRHMRSVH
ncbi:zinc finger protein 33A-like isoform X2 [Anoplophora glabripennis]|uniref:zinc finger protein 33A-like isoform X2 n=1 Tax=Anoplophora glabripennis TaxID=217634 RepID=UPI00087442D2|nr:zinc finger protein 33A-like isoform X2 [Anoplophora glabripennis]